MTSPNQRDDPSRIYCERAREVRFTKKSHVRTQLRTCKGNRGFRTRNILRVRTSKISCVSRAESALAQCAHRPFMRMMTPLTQTINMFVLHTQKQSYKKPRSKNNRQSRNDGNTGSHLKKIVGVNSNKW